mgnify:CR=1 FL=1
MPINLLDPHHSTTPHPLGHLCTYAFLPLLLQRIQEKKRLQEKTKKMHIYVRTPEKGKKKHIHYLTEKYYIGTYEYDIEKQTIYPYPYR